MRVPTTTDPVTTQPERPPQPHSAAARPRHDDTAAPRAGAPADLAAERLVPESNHATWGVGMLNVVGSLEASPCWCDQWIECPSESVERLSTELVVAHFASTTTENAQRSTRDLNGGCNGARRSA
jgi:hypothetical protein